MAISWYEVQTTVGRTLTTLEQHQAELWIGQARTIISRGPDGRSPIDLDSLDQHVLDMVVTEAVADRVKHPDSATQVDVSVDDGRVSRRYESGSGQIRIRDEWWALLEPNPKPSRGAFTIRSSAPGCRHAW